MNGVQRDLLASTVVIAAVRVVLPWSTCPIVPTFTCGLDRSNFSFAMIEIYLGINCLTNCVGFLIRLCWEDL